MKATGFLLSFAAVAALMFVSAGCSNGNKVSYAITMTGSGKGAIEARVKGQIVAEAAKGKTVAITAVPDEGYEFVRWSVAGGGASIDDPQLAAATFKMPAGEVEIVAEFELVFPDDVFSKITDPVFKEYSKQFDTDGDGKLSKTETLAVTEIDLSSENITTVASLAGIKFFQNLELLGSQFNKLTSLDVSGNTKLKMLSCAHNQLTSLDVSGCAQVIILHCANNQLTSLDVSGKTHLTKLYCAHNQLTNLDISKNTQLTYLGCDDNRLTSLDISKNTQLTYLYCNENPNLTAINVWKDFDIATPKNSIKYISKDDTAVFVRAQ